MGGAARGAVGKDTVEQPDEFGRGAAAAARRKQMQVTVGLHLEGVELRGDVVAAAVGAGQTGIGFDEDREIAGQSLGQPLRHGEDLFGAEGTVDAHRVGTEPPGGDRKAFDGAAGEGASACLKAHAGQNGQGGVLLGGQQRGLQLIQVGERLKEDQVGTGGNTGPDDPGVLVQRVLKGQRSAGLQQLSQRADVQRSQCAVGRTGPLAAADARRDDLFQRVLAVRQFVRRRTKGIGVDDPAAGRGVHPMDAFDQSRIFDVQLLGAGTQFQAGCLQHGAHATVQQDGMGLGKQFIRLHRSFPSFDIRSGFAGHSARSLPDVL